MLTYWYVTVPAMICILGIILLINKLIERISQKYKNNGDGSDDWHHDNYESDYDPYGFDDYGDDCSSPGRPGQPVASKARLPKNR